MHFWFSVTEVGKNVFHGCKKLADANGFVIVRNVLYNYFGNESDVNIPDGVEKIADEAFRNNEVLTKVVIPEGVKEIGKNAFNMCRSLDSIVLPESLAEIGESSFYGCKKLADENGFVIVGGTLCGYYGKESHITIPAGLKKIGENAFFLCTTLQNIIIPDSVTEIGWGAFEGCENLQSISISDGVTKIGENVFNGTAIKSLFLPRVSCDVLKAKKLMFPAAVGYLINSERYTDPATINEYEIYITKQRKKLLPLLFAEDSVKGLAVYADLGKITRKSFDAEYLEPAIKANATQCIAFLLDWKNKN